MPEEDPRRYFPKTLKFGALEIDVLKLVKLQVPVDVEVGDKKFMHVIIEVYGTVHKEE